MTAQAPFAQQDLITESSYVKHSFVGEKGMGADCNNRELGENTQAAASISAAGVEERKMGWWTPPTQWSAGALLVLFYIKVHTCTYSTKVQTQRGTFRYVRMLYALRLWVYRYVFGMAHRWHSTKQSHWSSSRNVMHRQNFHPPSSWYHSSVHPKCHPFVLVEAVSVR